MQYRTLEHRVIAIALTVLLAGPASVLAGVSQSALMTEPAGEEKEWQFNFELNLWGPDLTATAPSGASAILGVDDIIDDFQMAAMLSLQARKDRFFIGFDGIYMDLQDDFDGQLGPITVDGDVELTGIIVTPVTGYTLGQGEWGHFDLFAGARYLYLDVDVAARLSVPILGQRSVAVSQSGHEWAGIVGFKGRYELTEKWFLPFYFDIGAGEPDLTLQVFAGIGYRFNYCDLSLGYRYLKFDFDSGSALSELEAKGPMLGINFQF